MNRISLCLLLATLLPRLASAALVGPYTPDANTVLLLHLDEAAGSTKPAGLFFNSIHRWA